MNQYMRPRSKAAQISSLKKGLFVGAKKGLQPKNGGLEDDCPFQLGDI